MSGGVTGVVSAAALLGESPVLEPCGKRSSPRHQHQPTQVLLVNFKNVGMGAFYSFVTLYNIFGERICWTTHSTMLVVGTVEKEGYSKAHVKSIWE